MLRWASTYDAGYVALTQLQADAFAMFRRAAAAATLLKTVTVE